MTAGWAIRRYDPAFERKWFLDLMANRRINWTWRQLMERTQVVWARR